VLHWDEKTFLFDKKLRPFQLVNKIPVVSIFGSSDKVSSAVQEVRQSQGVNWIGSYTVNFAGAEPAQANKAATRVENFMYLDKNIEIEERFKIGVAKIEDLQEHLRDAPVSTKILYDIYFDTKSFALAKMNCWLRLRKTEKVGNKKKE
jgi:hypothetical protein